MEEIVLQASRRDVIGKQVSALRREGKLPAVIYGRHMDPLPIVLDLKETSKRLTGQSPSALITIDLDGNRYYALVRQKQRNAIKGTLRHVDFQSVSLTEKVRAFVSLTLVGEARAIKDFRGILVTNFEQLEVECLPRDLPDHIEIDLSPLTEIGAAIHVRDLQQNGRFEILADPDDVLVVITPPISEAALEAAEAGLSEPEVIEKGKREEKFED